MRIMRAMLRNIRQFNLPFFRKRCKQFIVLIPSVHSRLRDLFCKLKLRIQICRIHIARQIRRTVILPAVLIDLPPMILAPVRSLFTDDLRILNILFIPDQERAALSHAEVLRLVKAETAKFPKSTERFSLIRCHDSLRRIFHDRQMMLLRNLHDRIHLTAHARIVNRRDRPGLLCDRIFDQRFIDIHRIRPDIHKDRSGPAQHKSIRRRNKGIGGQDHLIPLLDIQKKRCQLRRLRTRRCEQTSRRFGLFLDPFTALLRKRAVTANLLILDGFLHIVNFLSRIGGNIKVNFYVHFYTFPTKKYKTPDFSIYCTTGIRYFAMIRL